MNETELMNALAATALNLYRLAMVAGNGDYSRQMRESILNPDVGDLVISAREWYADGNGRLGTLEHVVNCNHEGCKSYIVKLPDGRFETWRNPLLIKVPTKPFGQTS